MKETRSGIAAKAFSYFVIMLPVIMDENIRTSNHGILLLAWAKEEVSKYVFSLGATAAIFVISSVASSITTSMASSTVTMPTSLLSVSITGSARRSYFLKSPATSS